MVPFVCWGQEDILRGPLTARLFTWAIVKDFIKFQGLAHLIVTSCFVNIVIFVYFIASPMSCIEERQF